MDFLEDFFSDGFPGGFLFSDGFPETPKWFHMKALVQTVVLMCGMPILCENFPEKYQKWQFLAIFGL